MTTALHTTGEPSTLVAHAGTCAGGQDGRHSPRGHCCLFVEGIIGPSNWTHCVLERHFGNPVIPVKVLSEDGGQLLGTEQLLREDIYSGQPCPQDGLDFWDFLGEEFPYFACHHFHTGHH